MLIINVKTPLYEGNKRKQPQLTMSSIYSLKNKQKRSLIIHK